MEHKKTKIIFIVLVVLLAGIAFYFYARARALQDNPERVLQEQTQALVERVSKIILLPVGENPTVATVLDPEKLKDQPFFVHAKVGDKILIYANAKKAILYSPTENKIVNVAPLNIGK